MTTLTMRPHRGKTDLDAIAPLLKTCEAVALPDEWENADGQLIALAGLMIPTSGETLDSFLWFRVYPTEQVDILYSDIMTWAESRVQEVVKDI
ncbi:MAG: hypothetical protein RID09_06035 [Coleofasciculus sp. G1-WW12-02]